MRTLKFIVNAQKLEKDPDCDFSGLVSGSKGYLEAMFSFSQDYYNCKITAIFLNKDEEYPVDVSIVKNRCVIPEEALIGDSFSVRLIAEKKDYRICTNQIRVRQRRR